MHLAKKVKNFEFWRFRLGGETHRGIPNVC